MLEHDDMMQLYKDAMVNKPPSIKTPEAKAAYDKIKEEIKEAKAEGMTLDIPFEWPDIGD